MYRQTNTYMGLAKKQKQVYGSIYFGILCGVCVYIYIYLYEYVVLTFRIHIGREWV